MAVLVAGSLVRWLFGVLGLVGGSVLTRWYDRSPRARRLVFWVFTADVRKTDPEIYGRRKR